MSYGYGLSLVRLGYVRLIECPVWLELPARVRHRREATVKMKYCKKPVTSDSSLGPYFLLVLLIFHYFSLK